MLGKHPAILEMVAVGAMAMTFELRIPQAATDSLSERLDEALRSRPDLLVLERRLDQARIGQRIARSRRLPELGAQAQNEERLRGLRDIESICGPLGGSGTLSTAFAEFSTAFDELAAQPDRELIAWPDVVATSDAGILDRCGPFVDLPGALFAGGLAAWILDLAPAT